MNLATAVVLLSCILPCQHFARGERRTFTSLRDNPYVTYHEALTRCQGTLPDDQTAHDELVSFMKSSGIWQAWLGWRRSPDPWTWITSQRVENGLEAREGHDCGVLGHGGQLGASPCHSTLPVICEFTGVPCSQTYAAAYCASSNQTTLLVAPGLQGWYTARAFCRHLAGDLATPQHDEDITLAKAVMGKLLDGPFWIGARRNLWKLPSAKTELVHMTTNQWNTDQPGSGDCVVLKEEGSRLFWRTAQCTALYQVVCTASQETGTEPITTPTQNLSDSTLVDVAIYTGLSKANYSLEQLCAEKGAESLLSQELIGSMNYIKQRMRATQFTSAWLPWKRTVYSNWTWQNGDIYSGKIVEDAPGLCASTDMFLGASVMYVIPCHGPTVGYICQFNDLRPCWQTHHPYNCFHLGSSTLVVGTRVQSWYVASTLCTALGGQLAQLPQKAMVQAVIDFHKRQETLQATNFFHIGLNKITWQTRHEGILKVHNLWSVGNPSSGGTCSIMQLEGDSLLWRSADCTETRAVLCPAPPSTTAVTTVETETMDNQVINVTLTFNGTFLTAEPHFKHNHFLLPIGLIIPGVILVAAALSYWMKRRYNIRHVRRQRGTTQQDTKDQCDIPLLQTFSKPAKDIFFASAEVTPLRRSVVEMHPERLRALTKNKGALMANIQIEGSDLLDNLVKREVLTKGNQLFIKAGGSNDEQAGRLLDMLLKKNDEKYELFCDCLWEDKQDSIVVGYLATPVDFLTASKKVINYITNEFKDINMYTADGVSHLVPMDKIYVNVSWQRVIDHHGYGEDKRYHSIDTISETSSNAYPSDPDIYLDSDDDQGETLDWSNESVQGDTGLLGTGSKEDVGSDPESDSIEEQDSSESDDETYLGSYLDIFKKMQVYEDTRIILSGIAGSGKTSFMRHIGKKWIEAYKNRFASSESSPLKYFLILLPIILRLIRPGMSLADIIKAQIPLISYLEASSICRAMEKLHRNVLLIFDGYDELNVHNVIDPIISKQMYPDVSVVITTRPHGITLIQSLGSGSIEQLFYIYGFRKRQISRYIKLFFNLPGHNSDSGSLLTKELVGEHSHLSEMAKIPIQLEIICIVWNFKQKLGKSMLDLYQSFVECLEVHMKRKDNKKYNFKDIIHSLCRLANSWTKYESLEKVFSHEKLLEEFPQQLDGMIKFGCLVKYHPSTNLETSYWSFSHLTLQEYFLARGISLHFFKEEEINKRFSSVAKLERLEIVLRFICSMNPSIGNKILQAVLKKITDKDECKRLLDLIEKLIPEYTSTTEINLPLPRMSDYLQHPSQLHLEDSQDPTDHEDRFATHNKTQRQGKLENSHSTNTKSVNSGVSEKNEDLACCPSYDLLTNISTMPHYYFTE